MITPVGLSPASNLSDVASAATARINLGAAQSLARTAVKTSAYTAAAGDLVPVDTTSGAVTVTLPTAPADGSPVAVKHVIQGGSNAVTVACAGSDVFNKVSGSTSLTLPLPNQGVILAYNASASIWTVLSDDLPLSGLDLRYSPAAGSTSIVTLGTIATGVWSATAIGVTKGGTGLTGVASGKLLYASATDTLAPLTLGTNLSITTGTLNAAAGVTVASTSSVLKGDGAGNAVAATAGTDYPGLSSANTFTSQQIFLTGAAGASPAVFRQTGGTAGVAEVQVYHDGTRGQVASKAGNLRFTSSAFDFVRTSDSTTILNYNGSDTFTFSGYLQATKLFAGTIIVYTGAATDPALTQPATGVMKLATTGAAAVGLCTPPNTTTTLSAGTNNYSPGVGIFQRWSASTPVSVTGMVAGQAGEIRYLVNVGANAITLTNQDAGSTAANRWLTTTGSSLVWGANQMVFAIYDATTTCWRVSLLP